MRAPVGHAVVGGEDEGGPPVRPPVAIAQVGHQAGAAVDGEEVAAVRIRVGPGIRDGSSLGSRSKDSHSKHFLLGEWGLWGRGKEVEGLIWQI